MRKANGFADEEKKEAEKSIGRRKKRGGAKPSAQERYVAVATAGRKRVRERDGVVARLRRPSSFKQRERESTGADEENGRREGRQARVKRATTTQPGGRDVFAPYTHVHRRHRKKEREREGGGEGGKRGGFCLS